MALNQLGTGPIFRPDSSYPYFYHPYTDIEKRQLFLRSYQFSTKKKSTVSQRIKRSFFRVRRVIWVRLRSAKRIRKILWFRIKYGLLSASRKRRFLKLNYFNNNYSVKKSSFRSWSASSVFW